MHWFQCEIWCKTLGANFSLCIFVIGPIVRHIDLRVGLDVNEQKLLISFRSVMTKCLWRQLLVQTTYIWRQSSITMTTHIWRHLLVVMMYHWRHWSGGGNDGACVLASLVNIWILIPLTHSLTHSLLRWYVIVNIVKLSALSSDDEARTGQEIDVCK